MGHSVRVDDDTHELIIDIQDRVEEETDFRPSKKQIVKRSIEQYEISL